MLTPVPVSAVSRCTVHRCVLRSPSLWSCVQHIGMDHSFLSWCIPLFSVGRMFGSYAAGRASDRWNDDGVPTLACLIASVAGGAIYVIADMHRSWLLLLLAEFTMGLGGGTLAVLRAHVSKITTDRQRMSHTTYISTAQFVGLGLMPLAALAINYAFVGQHHRDAHAEALEEHNLLLATATGMMGDALSQYASAPNAENNQHFLSHYRAGGGRRNKHPGLENSASHIRPSQHGGRHLLSLSSASHSASDSNGAGQASSIGGNVAAAAAMVAPVLIPTGAQQNDGSSFLSRFFNHRTAPALLLIVLNLGCMLLYFLFFEAAHQSLEFQAKKAVEAAKRKVEQAVQQARREGREFDADNEVGGQSSAFSGVDAEVKDGANADVEAPAAAASASADASSSSAAAAGSGSKQKPKELIFDLSKLDALNLGGGGAAADASSSSDDAAAASAKPALSIVQVSDTTVIVLKPFASDASSSAQAETPASSRSAAAAAEGADGKVSHRKVPVPSAAVVDADLEMDRRGSAAASSARGGNNGGGFASLMAGAAGMASAVAALFKPDSQAERAAAASKGSIQSTSSAASASAAGSSAAGFDGGQRGRIAAYESGRLSHDLDNEGVPWGPFVLTPERMVLWGSCLFVYLNYTIRGVLATVETVGTPTLARFRHIAPGSPIEVEVSATFFGLLGLLGCGVFFAQWLLQDRIDEPTTLVLGFAVTVIGSGAIVFAPHSEHAFMIGCICIWSFGLPAVQNSVLAALSRILGTRVSLARGGREGEREEQERAGEEGGL